MKEHQFVGMNVRGKVYLTHAYMGRPLLPEGHSLKLATLISALYSLVLSSSFESMNF